VDEIIRRIDASGEFILGRKLQEIDFEKLDIGVGVDPFSGESAFVAHTAQDFMACFEKQGEEAGADISGRSGK
jgi:hypothetical protein